ncbi:MAG: hypothetical protein ACLVJ6_11575 [Merdibacter sp.]
MDEPVFVVIVGSKVSADLSETKSRNMVAKLDDHLAEDHGRARGGKAGIRNEEIVLDDVIYLKSGMQIASDCVMLTRRSRSVFAFR